ncbi:MAG: S-methyl-5'-thioadenosine phosphorylase [Janthinobacterium lividum]
MTNLPHVGVGIIGGSGFYSFLEEPRLVDVPTPFGPPSAPIAVGSLAGREVAFLPRHGVDHRFPPHRIPYRANLWALRHLGVAQVLTPCAVGSLQPDLHPGDLVVPDQLVDLTSGRIGTYYDGTDGVEHAAFADPYSPTGARLAVEAARASGLTVHPDGTLVVISGPRFSSRAESRWYSAQGWSVIGMTGAPETALARELGMECTSIAMVTDYDAGVRPGEGVTQEAVLAVMAANLDHLRAVLVALVPRLPTITAPPLPTRLTTS